ncbi:hypothetical protein SAMN02745121_08891 [Nannocystis exedens]|uniref:Uncharacterized protein n=1 Tax=Nannocystis exedens TaxID=54 RepID=A0A1I2ITS9_9BACT|nr:hypothetical protein [Nannocystis exedens]PCC69286.1 hypothetical protein NAEX_02308 [Nannocystis exedens]SFF44447.1 hypothetical protein SAMN02745121_08891 [Nannocystis exedens]
MAIEFMVMPLSRYIAGDFISPAMRIAWDAGLPYSLIGPHGMRQIPQDTPFGGADASARREAILEMLLGDLRALPEIGDASWDESSVAEPAFHRVDPGSYEALLEDAARPKKRGLFGIFGTGPSAMLHLGTTLLLPCDFAATIEMTSPFVRRVGSTPRALKELSNRPWSARAASAVETLRTALQDAARRGLPMIVDQ